MVRVKRRRRSAANVLRYLATGALVVAALVAARDGWTLYATSPWTRDGMVRVQVANVAPQVSGQIVEVRTYDNQRVHKGDVLYVIDKFDFQVALDNAKATVLSREADRHEGGVDDDPRHRTQHAGEARAAPGRQRAPDEQRHVGTWRDRDDEGGERELGDRRDVGYEGHERLAERRCS